MSSITSLTTADHCDYENFVSRTANARYAHGLGWAKALQKTYGLQIQHLIAREGSLIVGVLPLFFSRSWVLGKHYSTSPFPSYAGPLYESQAVLNALLKAAYEKTHGVNYTFLYTGEALPSTDQELSLRCDNLTFCLPLEGDPETIFAKLRKNIRRDIRYAAHKGIEIVADGAGNLQEEFYRLYTSIYAAKHGLPPHPRSLFRNLWDCIPTGGLRVYLARYKGKFVAATMTLRANGEIYYAWAAADPSANTLQPTTALIWNAIQDGCVEGFQVFNMGEAPKGHSSLVQFKTRWCPKIRETHSYYLLGRGAEPPADYFQGFGWQKKIIARLPLSLTTRFISPLLRFVL